MWSKPFCNILLYSKALIDFSQRVKQLISTSSWKGSPHHDTSSSMLKSGRDAFTIVFLTRSLNTPLWSISMQLKSWFITPHNSQLSIFWQKRHPVFDVFQRQQWLFNFFNSTQNLHYITFWLLFFLKESCFLRSWFLLTVFVGFFSCLSEL